jgi:predicted DNA-binding transcriptional regulator YafY
MEGMMDRTERFYKIDKLLAERKRVTFAELTEALSVSPATLKRDLEYMRNRLHAPIIWDREERAYRFDTQGKQVGDQYELPGLWFNAAEIHALLTMQQLLSGIDSGGLLGPHVQPLIARLNALMGTAENTQEEIRKRVKILGVMARQMPLQHFEVIGSALLRRHRLAIRYYARSTDKITEREVSPQRLVHYRENWYLDAWCHTRDGLRSFSLDSFQAAVMLDKSARDIAQKTLDETLGSGYGIFSGKKVRWAKLRFTAERARWVSAERWHSQQRTHFEDDGRFVLEIPFADDRELLMDILKYGRDVEVVSPAELQRRVVQEAQAVADNYSQD